MKSNGPVNSSLYKNFDIYNYFVGIDGLKHNEEKPKPASTTPPKLSDIRRSTVANDIDPMVLKVKINLYFIIF